MPQWSSVVLMSALSSCVCSPRYLLNIQPEDRQKTRDDILSTDRSKFKEFAEYLEAVKENGSVVVCFLSVIATQI